MLAGTFKPKPPITTVISEPQNVIPVFLAAGDGALNLYNRGIAGLGRFLVKGYLGYILMCSRSGNSPLIFLYSIWGMQEELKPFLKPTPSISLMII